MTPPRCPEHMETFLTTDGECPEDDCDYKAPRYQRENPANIFDSDWDNETDITFEIDIYEACIAAPKDNYSPSVDVKVSLPVIGTQFTTIPMFRLTGSGTNERLEQVYRGGQRNIVGIYNDGTYVKKDIAHDDGQFGSGDPWEDLYVEAEELLWDSEWPETTDPLHDIELNGVELE